MRADAQRNRDRIVEVARGIFREQGYDASLDDIAKAAEVGAGTLYRHFPNRESLLDAVMQSWVDRVEDTVGKALAREGTSRDVLVGWFADYVALITLHRGGAAKITGAMGNPESPIRSKCQVLVRANAQVVDHLIEAEALRPGTDPVQVCRLIGGVATVADTAALDAGAVRPMLEIIADGLLV